MMNEEMLMTPKELSVRWRISTKTLANWRTQKKGPKFIKLGGARNQRVFYRNADIVEYEETCLRGNADA